MLLEFKYHDQFQKDILEHLSEDTAQVASSMPELKHSDLQRRMGNLLRTYEAVSEMPEFVLTARFQRIVRQAKDLAYCTTSNLAVKLSKRYFLTLQLEGDFLIIDDAETMQHLTFLLSNCLNFRVFPKDRLFQLHFFYDLRLLEA